MQIDLCLYTALCALAKPDHVAARPAGAFRERNGLSLAIVEPSGDLWLDLAAIGRGRACRTRLLVVAVGMVTSYIFSLGSVVVLNTCSCTGMSPWIVVRFTCRAH